MTATCRVSLLIALSLATACAASAPDSSARPVEQVVDLERFFGDIEGTFVLLDPRENRLTIHNPVRARQRFLPASTFKIPNTLIALETGVADGPEFAMRWDSAVAPRQDWWPASWAGDHTLRTAFANSAVWYYQEVARRVGEKRMQQYVDRFEYGNRDISGGIDSFWLSGGLRISPLEQVGFLRRFYRGDLGVSDRTSSIARELFVLEEGADHRLSGKTGWASLGEPGATRGTGWLVGYLERGNDVWFFATNIEIRTNEDAAARLPITRAILDHLGLIGPVSQHTIKENRDAHAIESR